MRSHLYIYDRSFCWFITDELQKTWIKCGLAIARAVVYKQLNVSRLAK